MKKSILIFAIAAMSFSLRAQTGQTYTQMISDSKIQDFRFKIQDCITLPVTEIVTETELVEVQARKHPNGGACAGDGVISE